MKYLKAFGQFWYDFIIGDDWKVAAAVVGGLAITGAMVGGGVADEVITAVGGLSIVGLWLVALLIDQWPRRQGQAK